VARPGKLHLTDMHLHARIAYESELVRMYYGSGTGRRYCTAYAPVTHQMAALFGVKWRHGCHLERIFYAKNIPVKFHPDPIWNDRALGGGQCAI